MTGTFALIVAAGRGERLGGTEPKQYQPLAGTAILRRAVEPFARLDRIDGVRVVIDDRDRRLYEGAMAGLDLMPPVTGGASRQDSVRLGLESLERIRPGHVLIHDAARPLADHALITRVIEALSDFDGAVPALAVADSLKLGTGGVMTGSMPREGVFRAQTPQGFRFDAILEAHRRAHGEGRRDYSDDAAVAADGGIEVALVAGAPENVKITAAADLAWAERILAGGAEYRVGQGFDVHAFDPAKPGPVRLCGVELPHDAGLAGHSDADAGLHALTDALLGAIGAGDIGQHFPPGEPRWKDADSRIFLRFAAERVAALGARIVHVDVTVICEAPRIAAHRDAMRACIAEILGLDAGRVSVKATTTERLGALGRGEGVAAQAVATVAMGSGG